MKNNRWFWIILMALCLAIVGLSAGADESSAEPDKIYFHIFIPGSRGKIELFRVLPAMSMDECKLEREQLLQGSHSRAIGFCAEDFQHAGNATVQFKNMGLKK